MVNLRPCSHPERKGEGLNTFSHVFTILDTQPAEQVEWGKTMIWGSCTIFKFDVHVHFYQWFYGIHVLFHINSCIKCTIVPFVKNGVNKVQTSP